MENYANELLLFNGAYNLVSASSRDEIFARHILDSLAAAQEIERIAQRISAEKKTKVTIADIGSGGGFPGIPLAILLPEVQFHLVDSIGKKTKVAAAVAEALGLENVTVTHRNVAEEKERYDFVVSRAVMPMADLVRLVRKNIAREGRNSLPNGVLCLKGGDLTEELRPFARRSETWDLSAYFDDEFFETKKVAYVAL